MNNQDPAKKKIAVIGAGITGLNLAWKLIDYGYDVEVFEKRDVVGGVGTSVMKDGYAFEYGPHLFHTGFEELLDDFKELMKDEPYEKTLLDRQIKYMGKCYKYPLKLINVLKGLGFFTSVKCGLSFFYAHLKLKLGLTKDTTAEDWFINRFGKVGYAIYFKDYTKKVWGIDPTDLSPIFTNSRIPTISIRKMVKELLIPKKKIIKEIDNKGDHIYAPDINYIYYPHRGMWVLTDKIKDKVIEKGGKLYYGADVKKINFEGKIAKSIDFSVNGEEQKREFDYIISTIPLKGIINLIDLEKPEDVIEASQSLKHRAIVVACLVIKKPKVIDAQVLYFNDKNFNRVTEPKNLGLKVNPDSHTVILVEFTCDVGDDVWNNSEKYSDYVIEELIKENLITKEEILSAHTIKYPHAYPIYNIGYERRLKSIENFFGDIPNLYTTGRQGLFTYIDKDICMMMGKILAEYINEGGSEKSNIPNIEGETVFF
ncbi:MAG: NAD(P)-binding protein [bacterium]|nr:NAD(P)-binding protein [bacterium]